MLRRPLPVTLAAHPRRFLLHHTAEGRIGICAEDDLHPPVGTRGASLSEIGHSLATAPLWGGEEVPASPVGAIVAEMQAEEGEA